MKRTVLLLALLLSSCAGHQVNLTAQAPATWGIEPGGYESGTVTRIVDGDTVEVEVTGRVEGAGLGDTVVGDVYDVRLVGIDTPESVKPGSPVECFGKEASSALDALIGGREVRMVTDVENTDQYDRLLRYIYLGEEMANARMVVNGYAAVYTYPPNVRHADLFVEMQRQARDGGRGLWSLDTCSGRTS